MMASRHKHFLILLISSVLVFAFVVPTSLAADREQAQLAIPILVVNTSFLNVRSGDGPQYTVVATVVGGTELPALASNRAGTWYLVSTPVGNGWVDVAFTLPRGDFRFVPTIDVEAPAQAVGSTPLTIGLIGANPAPVASTTRTVTSEFGKLNVLSVNLRSAPDDAGSVITTLFRDDNAEFAVVGRAFDKRFVLWAAIVVPNYGTGWVESAKLITEVVEERAVVVGGTGSDGSGIPFPRLEAPIIVVNTSFQNIRTGPGGQYTVILSVPGGTVFNPVGITSDLTWYLVSGDFGFGWIASEFVLFRGDFRNVPILEDLY
ncbi:MAG: hypothetical protein IPK19_32780 [Chloroflexi bacterium]|nr:hypothetical protein [Chloroflexota bacterium]